MPFYRQVCFEKKSCLRVAVFLQLSALFLGSNYRFALCKMQSEFYLLQLQSCKSYEKIESSFFPKENLIHLDHTLPHYIHILIIHCMLLSPELLLILKIALQNAKNALQFLKKKI